MAVSSHPADHQRSLQVATATGRKAWHVRSEAILAKAERLTHRGRNTITVVRVPSKLCLCTMEHGLLSKVVKLHRVWIRAQFECAMMGIISPFRRGHSRMFVAHFVPAYASVKH